MEREGGAVQSWAVDARSDELSLRDYGQILRRHWIVVLATIALVTLAASALTFQAPERFRSQSTVLIYTSFSQSLFPSPPGNAGDLFRSTPNEVEYARSSALTDLIGGVPDGFDLSIEVDDDSRADTIRFVVEGPTRSPTRQLAGRLADTYVSSREQQVRANTEGSLSAVDASIAELTAQRDELLAPLEPLDEALARETNADTISRLTTQRLTLLQSLDDDLNPIRGQLSVLNNERSRLAVLLDYLNLTEGTGARVLGDAAVAEPVGPSLARNAVLGLVVGAILAAAAALLLENLRDRVRGVDDVERALPGVPVLAVLPDVDEALVGPITWSLIERLPTYRAALESLIASLRFVARTQPFNSLVVTAAAEDTGKSTVSLSLAAAAGHSGELVTVVEGDLHRPSLERLTGARSEWGLTDMVTGRCSVDDAGRPLSNLEGVRLIGAGSMTIEPADVWQAVTDGPLLNKILDAAGLTVFDSPPLLARSDGLVLASHADVCVLLARVKTSRLSDLDAARQRLLFAGATLVGVVVVGGEVPAYYGRAANTVR